MDLRKINLKFFLDKGEDVPLASFVPAFLRWIQEDKLEGLLVDLTEYNHVHQGPGVLLMADEANYSVDETDGKRGLLYNQKRTPEKSSQEHLETAFRRALKACALLEKEPELGGRLKFAVHHLQIFVNDRLEAPYSAQSLEELEGTISPFLTWLYGGEKYLLLHEKNPRKRTGFEVKFGKAPVLETLLKKLEPV